MAKNVSMPRRALVGIGAATSLAIFSLFARGSAVRASTITSWDYSMNAGLSHEAIGERFDYIEQKYAVGEPLSDEDADFVLRHARPAPTSLCTIQSNIVGENDDSGYQLSGSARFEYLGNFVYHSQATLQVGSSEHVAQSISIRTTHAIFGYAFPFSDTSFSMIGRFEHNESSQEDCWFTVETSDDLTGVAVASWQSSQAIVTTDAGRELLLKGAYRSDGT